jgi:hypothetical protein
MAVVVLEVEAQDAKKLPTPNDQEMIQALPAHSIDPALDNDVGVRGLDRYPNDLRTDRAPDPCLSG